MFCAKSTMYPVSAEETYTSASKKGPLRGKKKNRKNTKLSRAPCDHSIKFSPQNSKKSCSALSGRSIHHIKERMMDLVRLSLQFATYNDSV